jgi:hypothetical protein
MREQAGQMNCSDQTEMKQYSSILQHSYIVFVWNTDKCGESNYELEDQRYI